MAEKFGIETIKEVFLFGSKLGTELAKDLKDKKLSLGEILALTPTLLQIPNLIEKKDLIIQEAQDLSVEEVSQLTALAQTTGAINKEDVVATIKDGLNIAVSIKNLILRYSSKHIA